MEHTHRLSGQQFAHDHGEDEVRSDLTYATHGYYGHVEDQAGHRFGNVEARPEEQAARERQTGRIRTLAEPEVIGTVELDTSTNVWAKGIAKGDDLIKMLDGLTGDDAPKSFEDKIAWYWLYVGTGAVDAGITAETMLTYVAGASLRKPERTQQFVVEIDTSTLAGADPENEDEMVLGQNLAMVLRDLSNDVREMGYADHGDVYSRHQGPGKSQPRVGTWAVHG